MEENIENTEPAPESTPPAPEPAPEQTGEEQAPEEPKQEVSQDAKNMAMLCHLLGLLTIFIGPLVLWLIKQDDDPFIDKQGKEALNFQITVAIALAVSGITYIGIRLILVVLILDVVFSIIACVKAGKGDDYRYPVALRLVK